MRGRKSVHPSSRCLWGTSKLPESPAPPKPPDLVKVPEPGDPKELVSGADKVLKRTDVVMTKAILARGGAEANPLVATFIDHPASPLLVKGLLALGIGVLLVMSPIERRFVDWAVGGVVGVYSVVVCWNITVLFQAIQATS